MFTGLVQAVGRLERCPAGVRIRLPAPDALGALQIGDSIAVDGVCLTVAERMADGFRADVSEETLARTTLAARAAARQAVNLEPALRLSDRLGGHLVSGHVDGLGEVSGIERLQGSWRLAIRWQEPAWGRFICEKGSVAVDGISLTVAGLAAGSSTSAAYGANRALEPSAAPADGAAFWIAVIPHTWASTTLQHRRPGDLVNLEADLLARYTERLLQSRIAPPDGAPALDAGWLAEHGWG